MISPSSHENLGFPESNMTVRAAPLSIRLEVDSNNAISNRYAPYSFRLAHTLTYCRFGNKFLINFIDCPGHLDLTAEVSAALQIADGALLVVDYSLSSDLHTETVLRRVLVERVRPALVINKLDVPLLEKDVEKEAIYQSLKRTIDNINASIPSFADPLLGDAQVFPERGNVAFISGLHGWSFTLRQFARRYAKKFGIEEERILRKLWGESYFNRTTQKWTNIGTDASSEPLERVFNMFVLEPILKIVNAVTTSNRKVLDSVLDKLGLQLSDQERGLEGNELLNAVMRKFLLADEALLEMIVIHLPSPLVAQRYRVETLYEGSMDDEFAVGIRECDPKAPLVLYVSKMLPSSEEGRFYALGCVFSGSISAGHKVRVQGPNYQGNFRKDDLYLTTIEEVLIVEGHSFERVDSCTAGNIVVLLGVDKVLLKGRTITTSDNASNIKAINPTMRLVQVSVEVKKPLDLPVLVEGLRQMLKLDLGIQTWVTETGEHIVAGTGELHLETCLKASTRF
jgi:elongation factor 2